jgi:two-component system response regulator FixJ
MRYTESVPKIAVVDDDEAVRHSISRLLLSAGYQCEVFGSAEAFLKVCLSQQPDCAVIDFRLPGMNGLDLQHILDRLGHSFPIIMVSAYDDRVRGRAMENGAVAVFGKPFGGDALLTAIRDALDAPNLEVEQ